MLHDTEVTLPGVPCNQTNPKAAENLGFLSIATRKTKPNPDIGRPGGLPRMKLGGFKANTSKNEAAVAACSPAVDVTTEAFGEMLRYLFVTK